MRLARICLATLAFWGLIGASETPQKYAEGQVWEYKTRSEDAGSLLKIQKIEGPDIAAISGPIYHISIVGVHFRNAPLDGTLQHAPVSRQTLDASVIRLSKSTATFPDPSAGIDQWRNANGGVFTISVAEIISAVEQTVR